jgi:hypothetical protein
MRSNRISDSANLMHALVPYCRSMEHPQWAEAQLTNVKRNGVCLRRAYVAFMIAREALARSIKYQPLSLSLSLSLTKKVVE